MASNVKILLVDDNPMVLGMLQQALSAMGEVAVATDAADALLKAVDDLPDVLISDYRMPGMDGRQLLEKLKSRPATAGIAVILMASKADISERLSMQDPIEDYLEKPFFPERRHAQNQARGGPHRAGKAEQGSVDRWRVARQPVADERD
jgi:putative two-component system response regulator